MSAAIADLRFREKAAKAVRDQTLRDAMRTATSTLAARRAQSVAVVPMEEWRDLASAIRLDVLDHLPEYVDQFCANATKAGAVVHRARDAQQARETVFYVLKDRGVRKIVKAKSRVTEEVHLNEYLQARAMEVIETDLGEYIVQIAGETPSHILAPAIHKNRRQIGRLFAEKLGAEYFEDPAILTKIARRTLRQEFLSAQAGISGANFGIAETGSLVLFTNEGNGRMVTTLPKLHIALISLEKIIPTLKDLAPFMRLLARSATGQVLSSYLSIITGTRKPGETTGAEALHIILVDNGRTRILAGECREILKCIRCSACMNVCPVYKTVGGHAYGSTYPGPMGIVLTNELDGLSKAHSLLEASTLCGACDEVCPVRVPLVRLIRSLRERRVAEGYTSAAERAGMASFGLAVKHPPLFSLGKATAGLLWPVLTIVAGDNSLERFPRPARETFRQRMKIPKGSNESRFQT
jgi:L-lactate dehydrogenase complex protein LldF